MSINLNDIKAGSQRWWRPNLFSNGNFEINMVEGTDYYTNAVMSHRAESIGGGNGSPVYPVVGKYFFWLSCPANTTQPYIRFLQNIPCSPQKKYTVSWWEMNANPPKIADSQSYICYNNNPQIQLFRTPVKDSSNFHRVSATFQAPAGVTSFQLQLGIEILGIYPNNAVHLSYSGIYVCEGEETPYHWVPAPLDMLDMDFLEDYVYWKLLDDQNKIRHEKGAIASHDKHGLVKLHPVGDFYTNNAGELNLQPNLFI